MIFIWVGDFHETKIICIIFCYLMKSMPFFNMIQENLNIISPKVFCYFFWTINSVFIFCDLAIITPIPPDVSYSYSDILLLRT